MKPIEKILRSLIVIGISLLITTTANAQYERIYYAVEIDGVLCGYATTDVENIDYKGKPMLETSDTVHLMMKLLGQDMNIQITSRHIMQPETHQVQLNHTKSKHESGNIAEALTEVFDSYALRTEAPRETPDTIHDIAGVIFDNSLGAPHIIKDFIQGGATEKSYRIYDYMRGYIADQKFTLLGEEDITFAGEEYNTLKINIYNSKDGTNTQTWVNTEDGMTLRFDIMNRSIYLTDESVIKKITTVDLDNTIFAKVGKNIPNFIKMTYLKVSADFKSSGEEITVESLNFPGQKFNGTVDENHIQGIFEIEPMWYDGTDAPPFPPDFREEESLIKYLEPEIFIESDHPDIIAKAMKITEGSTDSWDATIRLSKWVGEEISGAVPGGTTAIGTLNTRQGECGSHSRLLAAFCRAVGIPSRLSVGCMYSPWYGGSFGQHAWTEVYMGEKAGWVAVDATILEFDYVDAGHIRLGELTSFHPEKMEIIEYRLGDGEENYEEKGIPEEYNKILGPYTNEAKRDVLDVQYVDGVISVDIKGKIMLALHEPDEEGRMYAQLTNKVYFIFPEDKMLVVENTFAQKKLEEEISIDKEIPENFKALIGSYIIFQIQKEFRVIWEQGQLAMLVPDVDEARMLEPTEKENRWKDPMGDKEYNFMLNEDGTVKGMEIHITAELIKGATAAWIIDKTIEKEGMEAAQKKFRELWDNRALDLEKTEADMNRLGYKYLGAERLDEALMVFMLNVEAYPQSWNVYDSYGEALNKSGDTENAIINYQKSIELNPDNENGKLILEGLLSNENE